MEDLDRSIVGLLLNDGRMSYTDLGRATGLSTSAVHQRVRRLEERGIIRSYTAVVDHDAVGLPLTAFISVSPLDPSAPDDVPERLRDIHLGVLEVIDRTQPGAMAVEGVFYAKNARTSVVLGHARGAVLLAAALRGLHVAEYPPAEVKSAVVGAGRATKDQVGLMVQRLLKLRAVPKPHDAADGIAIALCHCFRGFGPTAKGSPLHLKLPMIKIPGGRR